MSILHRFSTKYISSPDRLFNDDEKMRRRIATKQKHTGMADLGRFMAVLKRKKNTIIGKIRGDGSSQDAAGAKLRKHQVGLDTIMGDRLTGGTTTFQNVLIKTLIVPQMKLYAQNNLTLAVHEENVSGSKYRLTLRIQDPHQTMVLAASDDLVVQKR
jgi:hypothetical protein